MLRLESTVTHLPIRILKDLQTDRDYWRTLRQIVTYDPDQIQALYATPHRWTALAQQQAGLRVIQTDLSRWDYKHQVLESAHVPNWRVLLWMQLTEAVSQLRPKSLYRLLAHPDPAFRAAMRWYYRIGRRVWPYELWHWFFHDRRTVHGPTVARFLGRRQEKASRTVVLSYVVEPDAILGCTKSDRS